MLSLFLCALIYHLLVNKCSNNKHSVKLIQCHHCHLTHSSKIVVQAFIHVQCTQQQQRKQQPHEEVEDNIHVYDDRNK